MKHRMIACAALLAAALCACGPKPASPSADSAAASSAPAAAAASAAAPAASPSAQAALCADRGTVSGVKAALFSYAEKAAAPANRAALQDLATQSAATIAAPVLANVDAVTQKTSCYGQLHLSLPRGSAKGPAAGEDLTADIRYTAQPAADGSGLVYAIAGADDLVDALATADLTAGPNGAETVDASAPAASASAADDPARPRARWRRRPREVAVASDAYVCAHGDANSDFTIRACDRLVVSDAFVCARGDPNSDITIQACDRKDWAAAQAKNDVCAHGDPNSDLTIQACDRRDWAAAQARNQ